jgi:hypothetical protein
MEVESAGIGRQIGPLVMGNKLPAVLERNKGQPGLMVRLNNKHSAF